MKFYVERVVQILIDICKYEHEWYCMISRFALIWEQLVL